MSEGTSESIPSVENANAASLLTLMNHAKTDCWCQHISNESSYLDQLHYCLAVESSPTYAEAIVGPNRKEWLTAIAAEYADLSKNNVLSGPMKLPPGCKALDTKMVLKRKEPESVGQPNRNKARLCGKGFRQKYGIDYFDTCSKL